MHFLPNFFIFLDQYNSDVFKNKNKNIGIIYRNYNEQNRESELIKIAEKCKKKRYQLYISNDVKLALKYKANGIYIPSFNKTKYFLNLEKKNITILGSAHNQKEISKKISQKCKIIFLSPIFPIEKSKKFLGLHKFNYLAFKNNVRFYALGGISSKNILKLKLLDIGGFGGIRIFKKKTGLLKAGFHKELNSF